MNHHMVAGTEGAHHHVVRSGRPSLCGHLLFFVVLASAYFIGFGRSLSVVSIKLEYIPSHIPYIFSINGV